MKTIIVVILSLVPLFSQVSIVDTLRSPTGGVFVGRVEVSANCPLIYNGQTYTRWIRNYTVGNDGLFVASLIPTDPNASTQCGTPGYTVRYFPVLDRATMTLISYSERWIIPNVAGPLTVAKVRPPDPGNSPKNKCWTHDPLTGWNIAPCLGDTKYLDFSQALSSTWSVTAAEHGLGTDVLAVQCFDSNGVWFEPGPISISITSNGSVTVNVGTAKVGTLRLYRSNKNYRITLSAATSASATFAQHKLSGISWVVCRYTNGTVFEASPYFPYRIVGQSIATSTDIVLSFPVAVTGHCDVMGE
jgi:hypothetical protein